MTVPAAMPGVEPFDAVDVIAAKRDGAALTDAQIDWVVDAYTLMIASLLLATGSMADRFGRKRVFMTGLVLFAAASALCALAPTTVWLIAGRGLQAVGGAMLTPVA
ncbi:MAG: MFS transporter, partial [Actinomyces oris]